MANEEVVREALTLLKEEVYNFIETHSSLSNSLKSKHSPISQKYITKRLHVFEKSCPYKINYVIFGNETLNGKARAVGKVIEISDDLPEIMKFETLIHEWAHQILHLRTNAIKKDYTTKEVEAESVSFIVAYVLGLVNDNSPIYINEKLDKPLKNERMLLAQDVYKASEKRIINTSLKILNKLQLEIKQLEYHHKNNGKYL